MILTPTTIGYQQLYGSKKSVNINAKFLDSKSDLYIVMNDQIPFETDQLRYGGTIRETKTQYWIDLLQQHQCNYYVVHNTDPNRQFTEILRAIETCLYNESNYLKIANFERE